MASSRAGAGARRFEEKDGGLDAVLQIPWFNFAANVARQLFQEHCTTGKETAQN